ncbi:hypothetical protein [Luteolibacter luteus]|uniref:Uncharacterized protein n=1 Tax=Luteolibacter luteus TaxID=2728835 RepID=A0A858RBV1_9BACT|nr:hypothetical protein [Luteolibacter luteus]QJE94496.1 hypothetical protein HHL09_01400 [Luteolibacter luteus]
MKTRVNREFENDATPGRLLMERYRADLDGNNVDPNGSLALVHYRGTRGELDLGQEYSRSADPKGRITRALTLAQLGWSDRTCLDESVERLIELLRAA